MRCTVRMSVARLLCATVSVRLRVAVLMLVTMHMFVHMFVTVLVRMFVLVRMTVRGGTSGTLPTLLRRIVSHAHSAGAMMRAMAMAAPKPLSMFTTVRPAAQLDSMDNIGAIPPRCAP
jgi:hypothetical protein